MIDVNVPDDAPPRDLSAMIESLNEAGLPRHYILVGRAVKTVPFMVWATWMENHDHRIVGKTTVGPVAVSTVFLGLDHNWSGAGPPVLFETMVFGGKEFDQDQWRYCTLDEAEAGHAKVVATMRAYYGRWWLRVWERVYRWSATTWRHLADQDDWDWSTLRWETNHGIWRARMRRWKQESEWWQKQRESALSAAKRSRSPTSRTRGPTSDGTES